jgi:hypothetical protein
MFINDIFSQVSFSKDEKDIIKPLEYDIEVFPNTINGYNIPFYWVLDNKGIFYFNPEENRRIVPFSLKGLCARQLGRDMRKYAQNINSFGTEFEIEKARQLWENIKTRTPSELQEYVLRHTSFKTQLEVMGIGKHYRIFNFMVRPRPLPYYQPTANKLAVQIKIVDKRGNTEIYAGRRCAKQYTIKEKFYWNCEYDQIIKKRIHLKNRHKHGETVYYSADGKVEYRAFFEHGKKHGLTYYFSDPKILLIHDYRMDKLVAEIEINIETGSLQALNRYDWCTLVRQDEGKMETLSDEMIQNYTYIDKEVVLSKLQLDTRDFDFIEDLNSIPRGFSILSFVVSGNREILRQSQIRAAGVWNGTPISNSKCELFTLISVNNIETTFICRGFLICKKNYRHLCDPNNIGPKAFKIL